MNPQHLSAILWLRWRLRVNQLKRGGIANVVILAILAVVAVVLALSMFVGFLLLGLLLPPALPSSHRAAIFMYIWDGVVLAFLFWWGIGILTELQRSEPLSLDKLLHLPVSLTGAFLINYISSLASVCMMVFLPGMVGFSIGLLFSLGPTLLLAFPLFAAFLLMITALTYQFQGWLASLMANKRRRQTIIVMITMSMILFCQLPNLVHIFRPWERQQTNNALVQLTAKQAVMQKSLKAGELTAEQFQEASKKLAAEFQAGEKERNRQELETVEWVVQVINTAVPPGWLPLGIMGLAEGDLVPALLGTLGFTLFGSISLWRAYRTTIRYYTGQASGGKLPATPSAPVKVDKSPAYFFEKKFPGLSEGATVIALGSFRSLLRAPEAKMLLLSPVFVLVVFGSMMLSQSRNMSDSLRPLLPAGTMAMILFSMLALVGNQFGFDRGGFRAYVLSPVRRSDILLGKNLAIAPLTVGLGFVLGLILELVYPQRLDHLLVTPFLLLAMFLVFCIMGNWLSLLAPMAIPSGAMRAANPRGLAILLNFAFVLLLPLALAPTLLPLGIEVFLHGRGYLAGVPIYMLLTLVEIVVVGILYRLMLTWQGRVLQSREQRILELVAARAE